MLGNEISTRRKRYAISQRELARLINVKPNTMSQYENGARKIPLDVLANIAKVLKCSVLDLAYEEIGISDPSCENAAMPKQDAEEAIAADLNFTDPLDAEMLGLLKDLDKIAKEKVISYMRDQKIITGYYKAIRKKDKMQ